MTKTSHVDWMLDSHAGIALLTLVALEMVLSIDNIVFIPIVAKRLPDTQQRKA